MPGFDYRSAATTRIDHLD